MALVTNVHGTVFKKCRLRALIALLCSWCAVEAQAYEDAALRAAVVVNVLIFVQWPETTRATPDLVLCTDPDGELSPYLRTLAGRTVGGRVLRISAFKVPPDLSTCNAVLLQKQPARDLADQLNAGLPLMVLGDASVNSTDADVVSLAQSSGRIVFDVNLAAARRNKLQLSSKLLRLARRVVNE